MALLRIPGAAESMKTMNMANSIDAAQVATGVATTLVAIISVSYTLGSDQVLAAA